MLYNLLKVFSLSFFFLSERFSINIFSASVGLDIFATKFFTSFLSYKGFCLELARFNISKPANLLFSFLAETKLSIDINSSFLSWLINKSIKFFLVSAFFNLNKSSISLGYSLTKLLSLAIS